MNPLEIRLLAYGLLLLGIIGATAWATHRFDEAHYETLRAAFAQYQAQVQKDNADAKGALASALQAQIDTRVATEKHNEQLQSSLQQVQADAASAHADADFAHRLLAAAQNAGPATGGTAVPKAPGGRGSDGAASSAGDQPAATLLGDVAGAAAECRDAIQRLAALQLELSPQL